MSDSSGGPSIVTGPVRDLVGRGLVASDFRWPHGARIALSVVLNYEEGSEYSLAAGDRRQESLGEFPSIVPGTTRDLRTESVFEYGSRVGVWRLLRMFERREVTATVFATAVALERNPALASYLRTSSHEICGHGYTWSESWTHDRAEEKRRIVSAIESIEASCGRRPVGWNCRNSSTVNTRELLVEIGGFLYDSDAYNDDLPYTVTVKGKPHLVVPYTIMYNDFRYVSGTGYGGPSDFLDVCRRGLDYMRYEAAELRYPSMMTVGVHARYSGQAARTHALDEFLEYATAGDDTWIATREEIAVYWSEAHGGLDPGSSAEA